ncbi:hypothetical protein CCMA1212_003330 [Trichoderma ghanense]|uniref:Kinetochore protein Spc24 n=1 Tax=Trichoderma ghanense TaxID=65468 RepID=A0ABY2HAD4_9HYPO
MFTTHEAGKRTLDLREDVTALRNDLSALQQQVNQLRNSLSPPAIAKSELQSSSPPDGPPGSPSLYTKRIGFANHTEVEAAYQRDPADLIVKVKAILSDSLVRYRWDDAESVGISLDLLEAGDVQNDNFPSAARSDLVGS